MEPRACRRPGHSDVLGVAALGFAGCLLAVVGGCLAGAGAQPTHGSSLPWAAPLIPVQSSWNPVASTVLYFVGLVLLCRAWLRLRLFSTRGSVSVRTAVAVAALWAIPVLIGPPLASRDVYSYVALGQAASAPVNPYRPYSPDLGGVAAPAVDPQWNAGPGTAYGPAFTELAKVVASVSSTKLVAKTMWFRLLSVAGVAVATASLVHMARRRGTHPATAVILAAANPLVLIHLISGAHNDAIMLGLSLAGVALADRKGYRPWLAALVLCALGAAIKFPAFAAVAYLGVRGPTGRKARLSDLLIAGAVGVATLEVAGMVTGYGWGWATNMMQGPAILSYLAPATVLAGLVHLMAGLFGEHPSIAFIAGPLRLIGMVVGAALGWRFLSRSRVRGLAALSCALLVAAIFGPAVQPWYLTWGLLIGAASVGTAEGVSARVFAALTTVGVFTVLPAGPNFGAILVQLTSPATLFIIGLALVPLTFRFRRRLLTFSPRTPALSRDLTIIVPTRNEVEAIEPFLRRTLPMIASHPAELIFVDDSDDGTDAILTQAAAISATPFRVVHRRPGQRYGGLSGAVVEGFGVATGRTAIVMDCDLQHPPELIPALHERSRLNPTSVVVATRSNRDAEDRGFSRQRQIGSLGAAWLARVMFPGRLRSVTDPMSGFFAVPLGQLTAGQLNPSGFKILLEILVMHPELGVTEVNFTFAERSAGESKAGLAQATRYLAHLTDLRARTLPLWGSPVRLLETTAIS